jgi:phosphoribosyl 1,2-cyclic phosphate phosphodiesterase
VEGRFLFLGTGGSLGVPVVACTCPVCQSPLPYNKRLRPSGLLKVHGKNLLIDAGPDFRTQALKYGINSLDGILITHTHFDHVAGFDDLRVYYFKEKKRLECLLSQETLDELKVRYHYLVNAVEHGKVVSSKFEFKVLANDFGPAEFCGLKFHTMSYYQANMKVTGYRLGDFAYVSDIREYTDEVLESLKGVKTLVLSALRYTASEVHFSIEEALFFARKVGAERTWLTHIAHDLDHIDANARLPGDIQLAYDGLEVPFNL